jgi:hypothetical protein
MRKRIYWFLRNIEFIFRGQLLTIFYFTLLKLFSKCKVCYDGYFYPDYGVAPHKHDFTKTGSFIGSTELLPKDQYPDNYDDVDKGWGIYYCTNPNCKNNIKNKENKCNV